MMTLLLGNLQAMLSILPGYSSSTFVSAPMRSLKIQFEGFHFTICEPVMKDINLTAYLDKMATEYTALKSLNLIVRMIFSRWKLLDDGGRSTRLSVTSLVYLLIEYLQVRFHLYCLYDLILALTLVVGYG